MHSSVIIPEASACVTNNELTLTLRRHQRPLRIRVLDMRGDMSAPLKSHNTVSLLQIWPLALKRLLLWAKVHWVAWAWVSGKPKSILAGLGAPGTSSKQVPVWASSQRSLRQGPGRAWGGSPYCAGASRSAWGLCGHSSPLKGIQDPASQRLTWNKSPKSLSSSRRSGMPACCSLQEGTAHT